MRINNNLSTSPGLQMLFLLLLVFGSPTSTFTAPSGYEAEKPVYSFEFLTFRGENNAQTSLEVFCQIPTNEFQFVKFKDKFCCSYDLSIALYDSYGNQLAKESLIDSVKIETFKDIDRPKPARLCRFAFLVKPGEYTARVRLKDLETFNNAGFDKKIQVPDYHNPELQLSDLQVAASITATNEKNMLTKNNWKVVPNVPRIVSDTLYAYAEIYNLHYSSFEPNKEFSVTYIIKNSDARRIAFIKRKYEKPGDTCVLSIGIPVKELEEGFYQLNLTVADPDNGQTVRKATHFNMAKPRSKFNTYSELLHDR
ncbi:hypothetical protein GWO43_04110 [candidate division KSB1 bacterium]|nr:hypothetical protein [candidate division KSB1 bacterium]NIS23223.1 hypothetical protein [candidate division KSB1 bacterium]NIT70083.1 hypothetical protein [candidate division KSB1 bacterium]NIU23720.1 hypothetical protein [candidate division KSB1 bacterium]NIU91759.1 hypothetical protein [candidate division KSB1 bacterium]